MTWKTGNADEFLEDTMDDKMTEHVHEWALRDNHAVCLARNEKGNRCYAVLLGAEIISRLNATENLLSHPCSCDEAFTGRDMHSTACPWYHMEWAFGKSKEDILEGKDD